jgi:uncharacterized protein (DUF2249 family)
MASLFMKIPLIGQLLVGTFKPETYYTIDTTLMFQDSVHSAVLNAMDKLMEGKGLRAMTELERKPIMSDLFKRKL